MPVRQDNILSLLASAKAYRNQVIEIEARLRHDAEAIRKGDLTLTTREYNHDLHMQYHFELLDLERHYSIVIELTDKYYTEAIIRRNEKNKETQRWKRRGEGVPLKKVAVRASNKLLAPIKSPMNIDLETFDEEREKEVQRLRKIITGE